MGSHQKTQDLCQKPYENHPLKHLGQENVMNQCFRGVFMNTLLEVGYGFNTSQTRITMVQKVQGQVVIGLWVICWTNLWMIFPLSMTRNGFGIIVGGSNLSV